MSTSNFAGGVGRQLRPRCPPKQRAAPTFRSAARRASVPKRSGVGDVQLAFRLIEELLVLGRVRERRGRRLAALDGGRDRVEVTGADLALMLDRGEPLADRGEF